MLAPDMSLDADMRRREFISLLGGAAAVAARGTRAAAGDAGDRVLSPHRLTSVRPTGAFRYGLNDTGYIEGQNVTIEYRWAEANIDRLPALVADLVRRRGRIAPPAAILASGQSRDHDDPDRLRRRRRSGQVGLVTSLARPGGNATGINFLSRSCGKAVGNLHELVPRPFGLPTGQSDRSSSARRTLRDVRKLRAPSGWKSASSTPATAARSMQPSHLCARPGRRPLRCRRPVFRQPARPFATLATRHAIPAIYNVA